MSGPEILVPLGFFAMVTFIVVGLPLVRAIARRWDKETQGISSTDVSARLERMEQSIDSIAIEIERISEGQRFTTRLLADRTADPRQPLPLRVEADR